MNNFRYNKKLALLTFALMGAALVALRAHGEESLADTESLRITTGGAGAFHSRMGETAVPGCGVKPAALMR